MPWVNGQPGSHIPASIKREVRERQHDRCNTINPTVCTGVIDEFDHIINIARLGIDRRDANDPTNIQGLCKPCHRSKTRSESQAARNRRKRAPYQHPGLRRTPLGPPPPPPPTRNPVGHRDSPDTHCNGRFQEVIGWPRGR